MLLSNDYFNPASQKSMALLESLREPLKAGRLKSFELYTGAETPVGFRRMRHDVVLFDAVSMQKDAFTQLRMCYQIAMNRVSGKGAHSLRDMAVQVVYYTADQVETSASLEPAPDVIDMRHLQPILSLNAET